MSCEALLHPRAAPSPLQLRAPVEDGGGDGVALGMPRFWTAFDGDLALRQRAVEIEEQKLRWAEEQAARAQQASAQAEKAEVEARTATAAAAAAVAASGMVVHSTRSKCATFGPAVQSGVPPWRGL